MTQPKLRTYRAYLKPLKSQSLRSKIKAEAKRKAFTFGAFNDSHREILAAAIFEVENDFEHRLSGNVGARLDSRVVAMRGARNRLYDDLGWNESESVTAANARLKGTV